ncbi:hypothetical protein TNCT_327971, partial [Trichonephila clavata]
SSANPSERNCSRSLSPAAAQNRSRNRSAGRSAVQNRSRSSSAGRICHKIVPEVAFCIDLLPKSFQSRSAMGLRPKSFRRSPSKLPDVQQGFHAVRRLSPVHKARRGKVQQGVLEEGKVQQGAGREEEGLLAVRGRPMAVERKTHMATGEEEGPW